MSRVRAPSPALGLQVVCAGVSADVAQLVEHTLGKGEVTGSIPVVSSGSVVGTGARVMAGALVEASSQQALFTAACRLPSAVFRN